jgi:3-oxoacyl-[acyl-carrier-protein] synthase II
MRIWITGVGVVSPLAHGAARTMDRLVAGHRALGELSLFDLGETRTRIVAEVRDLSVAAVAPRGEDEGWSRTDAMAVLAAREALAQAGVDAHRVPVDMILGGTTAGMFETEDVLADLSRHPEALAPLQRLLSHPLSSTADHVRRIVAPFRHVRSVCSACSSGSNALLLAAGWLQAGRSTCVLAGGADGLCRLTFSGFGALAALDPEPCRPFDRRRAGLNIGEAAAFLVLEPESVARARGAVPIAELRGWAVGAEAHHITNPEAAGQTAARVMRAALARAKLTAADVDYVNAHGTATQLNDAMESAALSECFGPSLERVPVSSSKGQIGHTLGAAGAIEAVICALAIQRGVLPPTMGLEEVDPSCRLLHVTEARQAKVRVAMSNSFGFGGADTVLVLTEPGRFPELRGEARRPIVVTGAATVGPLGLERSAGSLAYLRPGPGPAPGPLSFNPSALLDVSRTRRLDRAGRLATAVVAAALDEAGMAKMEEPASHSVGAIVGSSFGSVDATTAFMRRVYDKGPKFASPAEFPNLVPSSPVGHVSIYLGLRGPVFAVADLGATAESAIVSAAELLETGGASAMAAGSVEEASPLIEHCLGPVCSEIANRGVRSEGASALVLERQDACAVRGGVALARLAWWASWRGEPKSALSELPPPPKAGALVLIGRHDDRADCFLGGSAWQAAERRVLSDRVGDHEGAGGFAAAAAVAALRAGLAESVLVLGHAPDRGFALLFTLPAS